MGWISPARTPVWVAVSSSGDPPDPGIEPASPALAGRSFTTEPPGKPKRGDSRENFSLWLWNFSWQVVLSTSGVLGSDVINKYWKLPYPGWNSNPPISALFHHISPSRHSPPTHTSSGQSLWCELPRLWVLLLPPGLCHGALILSRAIFTWSEPRNVTEGTVHTCASRAQETPQDQDPRTFKRRFRALGSPCLRSVLSSPIIFISFYSSTVFFISCIHHVFSFSFPCPQPQSKFCNSNGLIYVFVLALWFGYLFPACVHMLSCFSRVPLFATSWIVAHQAALSMRFFRQEHWSRLLCPSPGDLPNLGIKFVSYIEVISVPGIMMLS